MLKKFNLYAGIRQNGYNLEVITGRSFETVEEALIEARFFAEDLYEESPIRDVMEIMKEEKVNEDTAYIIYNDEVLNSIIWRVEEIIEINGEVIEIINHNPVV